MFARHYPRVLNRPRFFGRCATMLLRHNGLVNAVKNSNSLGYLEAARVYALQLLGCMAPGRERNHAATCAILRPGPVGQQF